MAIRSVLSPALPAGRAVFLHHSRKWTFDFGRVSWICGSIYPWASVTTLFSVHLLVPAKLRLNSDEFGACLWSFYNASRPFLELKAIAAGILVVGHHELITVATCLYTKCAFRMQLLRRMSMHSASYSYSTLIEQTLRTSRLRLWSL